MSHLTRFDSEMHEDEDDLEEVAAPIGDQQVSNFSFFLNLIISYLILKTYFDSFFYRARSQ